MALEKAELQPSSSWFLSARGGDVRLRLRSEIRIGEDDSGDLTFDPDMALVACAVVRGRLRISCVGQAHRLSLDDGSRRAAFDLAPGHSVRVELPNNQILLSDRLGANPADTSTERLNLRLAPAGAPTPIKATRRNDVELAPITSASTARSSAGIPIPTLELDQRLDPELPDRTAPTLLEDPQSRPLPSAAADVADVLASHPERGSGGSAVALLLWCLLTPALITADAAAIAAAAGAPATPTVAAYTAPQLTLPTSRSELASAADRTTPPRILPQLTQLGDKRSNAASPDDQAPSSTTDRGPITNTAPGDDHAAELLRARHLLGSGAIITPADDNAVKLLLRVLGSDPADDEARLLLLECADELLRQADLALAAGEEFQARNLVEEVRVFYPGHQRADQLWYALTGSRSGF